jgi:hypothetical protein
MGTPTIPNIRNTPLAENQQITVAWSAPSSGEPLSYRLTLNPGNQVVSGIPGSYREYTIGSLVNGTQYTISIDATNDGSTYGPAANFIPISPGGPPSTAVQNPRAIASGSNGISVSWNPPTPLPNPPPTFYIISSAYVYSGDTPVSIVQQASAGNSIYISNVNPTKAYEYSIQPVNDVGYGPLTTTNNVNLTQSGGVFDWGVQMYGNSNRAGTTLPCFTTAVATDTQNSLYATVLFYDSTFTTQNYHSTLGNGTISTSLAARFVSSMGFSGFPNLGLVKYSSTGTLQWIATSINNTASLFPAGLTTDSQNNIYLLQQIGSIPKTFYNANSNVNARGIMTAGSLFGTMAPILTNSRQSIVKYTSSGQVVSVTPITDLSTQATPRMFRNIIQTDATDNVYIHYYTSNSPVFHRFTGVSTGSITYLSTSVISTLTGIKGVLAKYDSNLNIQWATYTTPSLLGLNNADSNAQLAVDSNGNSYVTTFISSPSTVIYQYGGSNAGPTPGVRAGIYMISTYGTMLVSTSRSFQTLLTKYNTNGQVEWATQVFSASSTNTGVVGNAVTTDIYGNVFIAGSNSSNAPQFHSFQQRTSDGFISTTVSGVLDYRPSTLGEFIGKYDTNGQFLRASGMSNFANNFNGPLSNFGLTSDYLGNVYINSGLGIGSGWNLTYFDYYSTIGSNIQSLPVMTFNTPLGGGVNQLTRYTIRKYNNDLQMQYLLVFSNAPSVSSLFGISNICIDRTNAMYIVGSALNSTIGTGVGITTPQTYLPVPQWQGMRGPPYSGVTQFIQTSSLAISSPMVSTGTYGYLLRYK